MKYTEVTFHIHGDAAGVALCRDLLVYALGDQGPYDSFSDCDDGLLAYVPAELFDLAFAHEAVAQCAGGCTVEVSHAEMPDKDWNEEWERQYGSVLVEGQCYVRAPFHPHRDDVRYEIEIEPRMSFGTAHHQTTYMMLSLVCDEDIEGRRVLDMGCGTAVLAILASKRGASYVEAIDIDEWAYRNAEENCRRNGCAEVVCRLGDAALLQGGRFDVVLANINRNILLRDMERYVAVLSAGGSLLVSGFYESDVPQLVSHAEGLGLRLDRRCAREGWQALRLVLKDDNDRG